MNCKQLENFVRTTIVLNFKSMFNKLMCPSTFTAVGYTSKRVTQRFTFIAREFADEAGAPGVL